MNSLALHTREVTISQLTCQDLVQPFSLRDIDDARTRLGIIECTRRELLQPHPVLFEKDGEIVAQLKFCVLLMPSGPLKITGLDIPDDAFKSEKSVEDEGVIEVLKQPVKPKKKKNKDEKPGEIKMA